MLQLKNLYVTIMKILKLDPVRKFTTCTLSLSGCKNVSVFSKKGTEMVLIKNSVSSVAWGMLTHCFQGRQKSIVLYVVAPQRASYLSFKTQFMCCFSIKPSWRTTNLRVAPCWRIESQLISVPCTAVIQCPSFLWL